MESVATCKTLVATYISDKNLLDGPRQVEFITKNTGYKIVIEQCAYRKIVVTSEVEVSIYNLYGTLAKLERLLMLLDGTFFPLEKLEFMDSDNTDEAKLHTYQRNILATRLSYFSSADFCRYDIDKLLEFEDVLTPDLFSDWESLLEELDVVHQMYLYSMSNSKMTVDIKCAFLIELAEPLVEIVKKYTNFYTSLSPGKRGTSLKMCIDALITKYGIDIFETELKNCYEKVLSAMVNSRVRIMHIKREQRGAYFDGKESLIYISKMSLLYRRVLFDMLNIEEEKFKDKLQKSVNIYNKWNDILDNLLIRLDRG